MGMYDSIICEYPLPHAEVQEAIFQTKSFECLLDNYKIDEEGFLWYQQYDVVYKGHQERSCEKLKKMGWTFPIMSRENLKWVRRDEFLGGIRFYTSMEPVEAPLGSPNEWYEYTCYFQKGKMTAGPDYYSIK
jgi:hypothetical protein